MKYKIAACQMPDEDTDSPRSASESQVVGLRYEITTTGELSKEQIQSLAAFVEAQGEGVSQAKIAVHKDDEGAIASIMVELWGAELPGEELAAGRLAELLEVQALDVLLPERERLPT